MSSDILPQFVHSIKKSAFPIALQLDELTDVACMSQMLVFVRYVQKAGRKLELKEEFLFCLQTTTAAVVYTDGAPFMLGCKSGFMVLLKEMNPNLVIIHCIYYTDMH